jgi:hypothetical protein
MRALVSPTDIPGLYDVEIEDGRQLTDITEGQLVFLKTAGLDLVYFSGLGADPDAGSTILEVPVLALLALVTISTVAVIWGVWWALSAGAFAVVIGLAIYTYPPRTQMREIDRLADEARRRRDDARRRAS